MYTDCINFHANGGTFSTSPFPPTALSLSIKTIQISNSLPDCDLPFSYLVQLSTSYLLPSHSSSLSLSYPRSISYTPMFSFLSSPFFLSFPLSLNFSHFLFGFVPLLSHLSPCNSYQFPKYI